MAARGLMVEPDGRAAANTNAAPPVAFIVPPADLPALRPAIQRFLDMGEGVDGGRCTADQIWESIESGDSQCWLITQNNKADILGLCITSIRKYPNLKACEIELCAGHGVSSWVHLLDAAVEPWARARGCQVMEAKMRKGWLRYLPDYRIRRVLTEKWIDK